jgi:MinD-like ATPase involved in chromosome partitioning or flagellar assembly
VPLLLPAPSRYVVLAVGGVDLCQIPTEMVHCPTTEEAASALAAGRRYSAVVTDRVDTQLATAARRAAVPVLTASAASPADLADLAENLLAVAAPVPVVDRLASLLPVPGSVMPGGGRLVAVCGPGGTGASVVAAALAADKPGAILLADLALRADQAFLHGLDSPERGLFDLVDRARYRVVTACDVHLHSVAVAWGRLLPGLRRPEHWTAVSPAAFDAVLVALLESFDLVMADITGDLEGERDSGSLDVEERNHMARAATGAADALVVVGAPGANGARRLALLVDDLLDNCIDPGRIIPVVNRQHGTTARRRVCGLPISPVIIPEVATLTRGLLPLPAVSVLAKVVGDVLAQPPVQRRGPALLPVMPGDLGCRMR